MEEGRAKREDERATSDLLLHTSDMSQSKPGYSSFFVWLAATKKVRTIERNYIRYTYIDKYFASPFKKMSNLLHQFARETNISPEICKVN
jgi:hypothetical protein